MWKFKFITLSVAAVTGHFLSNGHVQSKNNNNSNSLRFGLSTFPQTICNTRIIRTMFLANIQHRIKWQLFPFWTRLTERKREGKKTRCKIYQMSNADHSLSQTLVRLNVLFALKRYGNRWRLFSNKTDDCEHPVTCATYTAPEWCMHQANAVVIVRCHSAFKSRDDFSKVLGKTYLIININKKTRDLSVGRVLSLPSAKHLQCMQATQRNTPLTMEIRKIFLNVRLFFLFYFR